MILGSHHRAGRFVGIHKCRRIQNCLIGYDKKTGAVVRRQLQNNYYKISSSSLGALGSFDGFGAIFVASTTGCAARLQRLLSMPG